MNADRVLLYMQAMQEHFKKAKASNVTFIHADKCPCGTGQAQLEECGCSPRLEIDGELYRLDVRPQLVPVKP